MSSVTLPVTFKAIGAAAPGAPFELFTRTVDALRADELLVKVSYASVNPMDVSIHQLNWAQLPTPLVSLAHCTSRRTRLSCVLFCGPSLHDPHLSLVYLRR